MALIVETGENIANANSYVSRQEFIDYAASRGVTIADNETADVNLVKAADYLQTKHYKGAKANIGQSLAWPRIYVVDWREVWAYGTAAAYNGGGYAQGSYYPSDVIPDELKRAQIEVAMAISSGVDMMPTQSNRLVKREKVGPLETEYESGYGASLSPQVSMANALLEMLLNTGGGILAVRRA